MHEVNYQQFKTDSTFYTSPDIYNGYITNISSSDNTIDIFISWSYGATNSAFYSFTFDPATFGFPLDFVKVGEPIRAFIPTNQESSQPIDIKDARSIKYRYLVFNSDQSIYL